MLLPPATIKSGDPTKKTHSTLWESGKIPPGRGAQRSQKNIQLTRSQDWNAVIWDLVIISPTCTAVAAWRRPHAWWEPGKHARRQFTKKRKKKSKQEIWEILQREKKRWENINSLVCQTRRAQQLFTCFHSFYAQMLWIKTQKCLADYDVRFCLSPVRAWLPSSPGCCISVQSSEMFEGASTSAGRYSRGLLPVAVTF